VVAALLLTAFPGAQFGKAPIHARVSLVAERSAAVPGRPLALGLRFEIDPGWHIYWRNPGDSGGPPVVTWQLPSGFTAGAFEWPAPTRVEVAGLVNYGYQGAVLLPLTIAVPAGAVIGSTARLAASVEYQICSSVCMLGKTSVELAVLVAEASGGPSSNAPLFADARARLPKPAPASWRVRAWVANHALTVTIETGAREARGTLFPLEPGLVHDSAPQEVTPLASGIQFTQPLFDQAAASPKTFTGVVVLGDGRAYEVRAPVGPGR